MNKQNQLSRNADRKMNDAKNLDNVIKQNLAVLSYGENSHD